MTLEQILLFFSQSFSLVLPILVAGLAFIWILRRNSFAALSVPIDAGRSINGKRIFGDNKTWRGVFAYALLTLAVCLVLYEIARVLPGILHPLFDRSPVLIGFVFSVSYVVGELINSFVKRRRNIAAGKQSGSHVQRIIDNGDGMAMVALVLFFGFRVSLSNIVLALGLGLILHSLTDIIMKRTGLKK